MVLAIKILKTNNLFLSARCASFWCQRSANRSQVRFASRLAKSVTEERYFRKDVLPLDARKSEAKTRKLRASRNRRISYDREPVSLSLFLSASLYLVFSVVNDGTIIDQHL